MSQWLSGCAVASQTPEAAPGERPGYPARREAERNFPHRTGLGIRLTEMHNWCHDNVAAGKLYGAVVGGSPRPDIYEQHIAAD